MVGGKEGATPPIRASLLSSCEDPCNGPRGAQTPFAIPILQGLWLLLPEPSSCSVSTSFSFSEEDSAKRTSELAGGKCLDG